MEPAYSIRPYTDDQQPAFYRINREWLDKYNLTESHDLMVLDDPKATIIDRGGFIWLAFLGKEVVGSAALMKEHEGVYEVAKMAVVPAQQGKGISKALLQACVDKAREIQAKKLLLFSNHQLSAALGLYEKFGFHHIEVKDSPFATADVKMELIL